MKKLSKNYNNKKLFKAFLKACNPTNIKRAIAGVSVSEDHLITTDSYRLHRMEFKSNLPAGNYDFNNFLLIEESFPDTSHLDKDYIYLTNFSSPEEAFKHILEQESRINGVEKIKFGNNKVFDRKFLLEAVDFLNEVAIQFDPQNRSINIMVKPSHLVSEDDLTPVKICLDKQPNTFALVMPINSEF